jgi:hypothetical protein
MDRSSLYHGNENVADGGRMGIRNEHDLVAVDSESSCKWRSIMTTKKNLSWLKP